MSTIEQPLTQTANAKATVLDAAQRLIHQYGYSGFSMRDLAQQSGLAKATLYHHFQDKREIFLQVLERDLVVVRDGIAAAAKTPGDLRTRLRAVIMAFFELATERGALLISTLRQAAGMECGIYNLMRRYRDELYYPVIKLLTEAVADGSIRPIDPELTTVSFFGIIQSFTSRHLLMADLELDEKATDSILDLLLNGLLPPSGASPSGTSQDE